MRMDSQKLFFSLGSSPSSLLNLRRKALPRSIFFLFFFFSMVTCLKSCFDDHVFVGRDLTFRDNTSHQQTDLFFGDAPVGGTTAIISPRYMTAIRSESSMISSNSGETSKTAQPSSRFGLYDCGYIQWSRHQARGLVVRRPKLNWSGKFTGNNYFLLVSTGKRTNRCEGSGCANVEVLDQLHRVFHDLVIA